MQASVRDALRLPVRLVWQYAGADHVRYTFHYPASPNTKHTDCHTYHKTDSPVVEPGEGASFVERHIEIEWVGSY